MLPTRCIPCSHVNVLLLAIVVYLLLHDALHRLSVEAFRDGLWTPVMEHLTEVKQSGNRPRVLFHCVSGHSRSPATCNLGFASSCRQRGRVA